MNNTVNSEERQAETDEPFIAIQILIRCLMKQPGFDQTNFRAALRYELSKTDSKYRVLHDLLGSYL
jgi:hypothetical protein